MGIVAKYKFDGSVYADLIPEFNEEFTDYTVTDEVDNENSDYIIRTIESDTLPTLMRFGRRWVSGESSIDNRTGSLLEVLDMDTRGLIDCHSMLRHCKNLTSITCEWDTSKVTNMQNMFDVCNKLTTLDVSNFDTRNVGNMQYMFNSCTKLTTLDVSNFDTSNVNYMQNMFYGCKSLTALDVSNFDTSKVTNTTGMFDNTPLLTDIGMIYCDQSTINKVASLLPTDHNITIWVESDDILQYDQYDHITYKTQKVQDTVHLNSPLLMGDTIEVIDGKTYHVHRYEKVVLDGSEDWLYNSNQTTEKTLRFSLPITNGKLEAGGIQCDFFPTDASVTLTMDYELEGITKYRENGNLYLRIFKSRLSTLDVAGLKQWLQDNPTTVIYQLATPYYELISEEPLELTLLDTTDNTINNNSILPSNMTIANKELSTIAIKPSTTYTLSFDKSNDNSEVTIDICGGEQITTVLNRVEITTPSELGSGIRFISSDGCIISNVRLLEGSLVESAIPKESFKGLQSSFDDGYIIGENLAVNTNKKTLTSTVERFYYTQTNIIKDTVYTVYCKLSNIINVSEFKAVYSVNGSDETVVLKSNISKDNNTVLKSFVARGNSNLLLYIDSHTGQLDVSDLVILEGDHTHLSEAELMRYIEKGTSHYEEEDYNHVGKYKVEYRVTGKNKFNVNTMTLGLRGYTELVSYDNGEWVLKQTGGYPGLYYYFDNIEYFKGRHWRVSCDISTTNSNSSINYQLRGELSDGSSYYAGADANYFIPENAVTVQLSIIFHNKNEFLENNITTISNIQIEEGTVATEYEPYKEDVKTYYLSSPLLEGDTIEDINGVATHVKRYGKVVLDGSSDENWRTYEKFTNATTIESLTTFSSQFELNDNGWSNTVCYSDKFSTATSMNDAYWRQRVCLSSGYNQILICQNIISDLNEFKQWLQANPTTIVYELKTPIYETISTESILCDSYVNGHLDVDTNIPIEKVKFERLRIPLKYQSNSTDYIVKFDSDNNGVINEVYFDGSNNPSLNNVIISKGTNILNMATGNGTIANAIYLNGIGFNASNIQVVEANEDKEFGYFKGLKSSFEDGLITDENDENYGKYKVECKIVGKNKVNDIVRDMNHSTGRYICSKDYSSIRGVIPLPIGTYKLSLERYDVSKFVDAGIYIWRKGDTSGTARKVKMNQSFDIRDGDLGFTWYGGVDIDVSISDIVGTGIQIEEGTQVTSYEPYKESVHTLYLNSPLLKGDKLVVHEGKLCHYHKMGMVVLNGSESWIVSTNTDNYLDFRTYNIEKPLSGGYGICDRFEYLSNKNGYWIAKEEGLTSFTDNTNNSIIFSIQKSRLSTQDANGFKQWLKANPTTVVYELASPYYEPIEPQLSQYSFSTVKDGDMEIITVLPIEKINLTYRTDINGVSSIEEQIASIQEGTDISSIIDEEVDE